MRPEDAVQVILGDSTPVRELRRLILKLAPHAIPVWIQGESGVGKELVANALHAASGRRGRFVACNVCALPESLFEASLFGHVRGAFSGALRDSDGLLAEAANGTLFLDEIGSLQLEMQPKLLRAVETGVFRPVGARSDRSAEIRIVAATNEDLEGLIERGQFRKDLSYRLRGCVVHVPALRARPDDIPLLAEHFLARNAAAIGSPFSLSSAAMAVLQEHAWPGNVRELKCVLNSAALLSSHHVLDEATIRRALNPAAPDEASSGTETRSTEPSERQRLIAELEAVRWDTRVLSRNYGVSRATIYRWMARLLIGAKARRSVLVRSHASRPSTGAPRPALVLPSGPPAAARNH